MKILFFNIGPANPLLGGVQSVTHYLAHYFNSLGHEVYIISIYRTSDYLDDIQFYLPDQKRSDSDANKQFLMDFIKEMHIEIVINQTCLDPKLSVFLPVIKKMRVQLVSVFHTQPYGIYGIKAFPKICNTISGEKIRNLVDAFMHFAFKLKYGKYLKRMLQYSDKLVMLSDKFINEFLYFTGKKYAEKVLSISNPVTIDGIFSGKKEKMVLFVGRISQEKGVDKILEVWSGICHEEKYKEWQLVIIGDGEKREQLEKYAIDMKLINYSFEGFQKPDGYYDKAKIFCMASSFEGFGLVLVEAMSYGVVPMAFNSFPNCSDIIDDNKNGILITPFSINEYRKKIIELMENDKKWMEMSAPSINKSKEYSIECIGTKWLDLFYSLLNNKELVNGE